MADPQMGTKVEAADQDEKLCGGTILPSAQPDVEGQWPYYARVICPWCGAVVVVVANTAYYKWFVCCVCGRSFRF